MLVVKNVISLDYLCYNYNVRLFIAAELPEVIKAKILSSVKNLRSLKLPLKWVEEKNIHLTIKFIGDFRNNKLADLTAAIDRLVDESKIRAFKIRIRGIGFFSSHNLLRVIWAGVEKSSSLESLYQKLEETLERFAVQKENRIFSPHLTLARAKGNIFLKPMQAKIEHLASEDFGEFFVDRFFLFQSELHSQGPVYTILKEFDLVSASD